MCSEQSLSTGIKSTNIIDEHFMIAGFFLYPKILAQIVNDALGVGFARHHNT